MRNFLFVLIVVFALSSEAGNAQSISVKNNLQSQAVTFGNSSLTLVLNYDHQCTISKMDVNGENVIASDSGIYSEIQTKEKTFSTLQLHNSPKVKVLKNT